MDLTNPSASLPSKVSGPNQAQTSRLMTLPGELRNQIYTLVFKDHVQDNKDWRPDEKSVAYSAALILTCKQVHQEALGIFYSAAVFESNLVGTMELWGSRIGKERARLIRHARILSYSSLRRDEWIERERLLHDRFIFHTNANNDFDKNLDIWYRTGLHGGFGFPNFYVWTRDPKSEVRSWRRFMDYRARHYFRNASGPQAAAQKEAEYLNLPSWVHELDAVVQSMLRSHRWRDTVALRSFWSTSLSHKPRMII